MRSKTRKFIWSAPLVAALAIIGALTLAGVLLLPNADTADAQSAEPANVTISNVTETSLDVSWDAVSGASTYGVRYAVKADTPTWVADGTGVRIVDRQARITGLTAGTDYLVQVRGVGLGDGPWSGSAEATTKALAKPSAVQNLEVTPGDSNTELSVSWDAPENTGGAAISGYTITIDPTAEGATCAVDETNDGTSTEATCTSLTVGEEYTITVVANNGVTTGTDNEAEATGIPGLSTGKLVSSSSSASSTVKLTLTIELEENLTGSSWVEIYLENDYQEPSSLSESDVIFEVRNPAGFGGTSDATVNTAFNAAAVEIDDGGEIAGEEDAVVISARIPDMNPADDDEGYPLTGQQLVMVVEKSAGIRNPSEEGSHSTGFAIIGGTDDRADEAEMKLPDLKTYAKISLSDEDNSRGYELTVEGSGFNNGTSAGVFVYHTTAGKPTCEMIREMGARVGTGTVGSDDKVSISFEVTVPIFKPGTDADGEGLNYICVFDGEARHSSTDIEQFELEPSIRVSPSTASVGDTVTIFAQDFPENDAAAAAKPVQLARQTIKTTSGDIGSDGSGNTTFDVPGWAEGTLRVDAWGEDTKLTIIGSQLSVSKSEALPNELITITGDGFSTESGNYVDPDDIKLAGVPLQVHPDSVDDGEVDVSSSGQFVATVVLWPVGTDNPTLTAGTHKIEVVDQEGFTGTAVIRIPEPTVTVTPGVAGPRDVVTVSGENWPVENLDGGDIRAIEITVSDGSRDRQYSVYADGAGRFFQEHQVHSGGTIPSESRVEANYDDQVVKLTSYAIPEAIINIEPTEGQPGDLVSMSVDKMPVYAKVSSVQIASRDVIPVGNFSTDRTGSVTVDGVVIPGLDPGTYSVLMQVGDTVAIGSINVLSEGPIGTETPVGKGLAPIGDSLAAVFYFDNVSKTWSFYDPRPEFAEFNTLTDLVDGETYWVLVSEDVEDVVLNNRSRSLTCAGGNCWSLIQW